MVGIVVHQLVIDQQFLLPAISTLVETVTISPGVGEKYLGLRNLLTCKSFKSGVRCSFGLL